MAIPKYDDLFEPLLQAMQQLGGSASIAEQEDTVASLLKLTDKEINEIHRGNRTKLSYRLAWARNYLKRFGILDNSARGVWSLTLEGAKRKNLDKEEVKHVVQKLDKLESSKTKRVEDESEAAPAWEDRLLEIVRLMTSDGFERLCQRLLRESGFIHVEITGRSGDGGIDGKGVVRVGGLLSFHVIFQCKRYKGSVGASIVRDFRGAMVGRADKGLLITTGTFTREARAEAQRDGAPPIDLVDGEDLVEKLKQLHIGVEVRQKVIEEVVVQEEFFGSI